MSNNEFTSAMADKWVACVKQLQGLLKATLDIGDTSDKRNQALKLSDHLVGNLCLCSHQLFTDLALSSLRLSILILSRLFQPALRPMWKHTSILQTQLLRKSLDPSMLWKALVDLPIDSVIHLLRSQLLAKAKYVVFFTQNYLLLMRYRVLYCLKRKAPPKSKEFIDDEDDEDVHILTKCDDVEVSLTSSFLYCYFIFIAL